MNFKKTLKKQENHNFKCEVMSQVIVNFGSKYNTDLSAEMSKNNNNNKIYVKQLFLNMLYIYIYLTHFFFICVSYPYGSNNYIKDTICIFTLENKLIK